MRPTCCLPHVCLIRCSKQQRSLCHTKDPKQMLCMHESTSARGWNGYDQNCVSFVSPQLSIGAAVTNSGLASGRLVRSCSILTCCLLMRHLPNTITTHSNQNFYVYCIHKFWAGIRAACEKLFHSHMLPAHAPLTKHNHNTLKPKFLCLLHTQVLGWH